MGAYENPQPIIDRSGEIIGQAAYRAGANIAAGIREYYQNRNIAAEKRKKETKRVQAIQAGIEERQYSNLNSNYAKLQKTSKSLADQFKLKTTELLEGNETQMGAIKAQTLLSTADLTKEERKEYRNIVQNAKIFQNNVLSGGADILVDLEDMADVAPQDLNTKFFFVGNNEFDELTSQFTASVLANKEIPGAQTTKELRNEDGAAIVSVSTVFDVNSEEAKALLEDMPDLNDKVQNGKLQFNWERNINELGDGFIKKIPEGLNADTSYKNAGIEDEKGKFGQNYMVGTPVSRREPSGARGRDNIVTTQYINTPAIFSNESLLTDARVKAKAMTGANDNGEIRAYLKKEYNFTNDDIKTFLGQGQDKQIQDLQELEVQRITDLKLKGKGFGSRIATEKDAKYMNDNAKAAVDGQSIKPVIAGETMIYFSQKSVPTSSIEPSTTGETAGLSKTAINSIGTFNAVVDIVNLPPMNPKQFADQLTSAAAGEKSFITGQEYARRVLANEQENVTQELIEERAKDEGIKLDFVYDANDNTKFINPADKKAYKRNLYDLFDLNTKTVRELETFISSQDFSKYKEN